MEDADIRAVLISILDMLKQQAIYAHRQHGWIIAVAETIREKPELALALEQHPFYDQGPQPTLQKIDVLTRNIDALIQRLDKQ